MALLDRGSWASSRGVKVKGTALLQDPNSLVLQCCLGDQVGPNREMQDVGQLPWQQATVVAQHRPEMELSHQVRPRALCLGVPVVALVLLRDLHPGAVAAQLAQVSKALRNLWVLAGRRHRLSHHLWSRVLVVAA